MYGEYQLGEMELANDQFSIKVEKEGEFYRYIRRCGDEVSKMIKGEGFLVINPVEPVNVPKNVTNFILIEFKDEFVIEPKSNATIYVTFPIEVGVFVVKRSISVLDVFAIDNVKYTLYGNPRRGYICRYWLSDVYTEKPREKGVLELNVRNNVDDWVEIKRVVLDVYGMKIYYDESNVISKAVMSVTSRSTAETQFLDGVEGMKKSIEMYVARRLHVIRRSFHMEYGLC